jgi:hypothetical protein
MELSGEINSVAIINGQQMYLSLLKRNTHFYRCQTDKNAPSLAYLCTGSLLIINYCTIVVGVGERWWLH